MIQIRPAIDIIDGKCVRLTQGDYNQQKTYSNNPVEMAKSFEDAGIKFLHLVDLDGAKAKHVVNYKVLENIAKGTNLIIDFGGGIKTKKDLHLVFEAGATQVTAGSIAVTNPTLVEEWIEVYGQDKIIVGADVRGQQIAINGWQESSTLDLMPFLADYQQRGMDYCICTDIAKDGLLQGSSIDLYNTILKQFPTLKLIASGGVTTIDEIKKLNGIGCYAVIVGKAIYEGTILMSEFANL